MSEERKKIVIDTSVFSAGGLTKKNKAKKEKPDKPLRIKNDLRSQKTYRNQFMKKLREKQELQYKSLFSGEKPIPSGKTVAKPDTEEFKSDFNQSLSFFENMVPQPPTTLKNHTFKNKSLLYHDDVGLSFGEQVNLDLPDDFFSVKPVVNQPLLKPLSQPLQQPFQQPLQQPFQQPLQQPLQQPFQQPLQQPFQQPLQQPFQQPLQQPFQQPLQQPLRQPLSQPFPEGKPQFKGTMQFPPAPQFGCLKGGSLPTLRSTLKANKPAPIGAITLETMRKIHEQKKEDEKPKPKLVQKKIKKILRRTFYVGKQKNRPQVGVLLPNKTLRNNVSNKTFVVKNTPISDVRKYLVKHGFIKVGSSAPTDVLRKMYESLQLIGGEVKNHNPDNLLFNFFKDNAK
jgi:hypothetical protein